MLSRLLFESLFGLLATLVAVNFLLIALWSWQRGRFTKRVVWSGLAAMPLLLLLSHLVVTPRERIIDLCRRLAAAVERGDVPFVVRHLDARFQWEQYDRAQFADRLKSALTRARVADIRLFRFDVAPAGDGRLIAAFRSTAHVRGDDWPYEWIAHDWKLTLRPDGTSYLIERLDSQTPQNLRHLRR